MINTPIKIKLKVYTDAAGVQWVAIGVSTMLDYVMVVFMHNELEANRAILPEKEWNALPHYEFKSVGPVAKTTVMHRPHQHSGE